MFLNGELGPHFTDERPPETIGECRIQIKYSPAGRKDKVFLDDVVRTQKR